VNTYVSSRFCLALCTFFLVRICLCYHQIYANEDVFVCDPMIAIKVCQGDVNYMYCGQTSRFF
jgi:hypothetical protein